LDISLIASPGGLPMRIPKSFDLRTPQRRSLARGCADGDAPLYEELLQTGLGRSGSCCNRQVPAALLRAGFATNPAALRPRLHHLSRHAPYCGWWKRHDGRRRCTMPTICAQPPSIMLGICFRRLAFIAFSNAVMSASTEG